MAKVRLAPGAWINFASPLLAGGGAVTGATSDQIWVQVLGYLTMALGLGVLFWGITLNDQHWWRRVLKSAPLPKLWVASVILRGVISEGRLIVMVKGFNGHDEALDFCKVQGAIYVSDGTTNIRLPAPHILAEPNIGPGSDFTMGLAQPLDQPHVDWLLRQMEGRPAVFLNFRKLDLFVQSHGNRNLMRRMPLWEGVRLMGSDAITSENHELKTAEIP